MYSSNSLKRPYMLFLADHMNGVYLFSSARAAGCREAVIKTTESSGVCVCCCGSCWPLDGRRTSSFGLRRHSQFREYRGLTWNVWEWIRAGKEPWLFFHPNTCVWFSVLQRNIYGELSELSAELNQNCQQIKKQTNTYWCTEHSNITNVWLLGLTNKRLSFPKFTLCLWLI